MTPPRFRAPDDDTPLVDVVVNDTTMKMRDGQTLAAALLASGIDSFGRSPRRDRPRGPYCLIGSCFQCAATVDGRTHVRTCRTRVRAGLRVEIEDLEIEEGRSRT